jgi:hypothetical protein
MDMNVNVYLPDELGERVKKADLEVSRICQEALAIRVEEWEATKAAKGKGPFSRIEVKVGTEESRAWITKAFSGRWLVTDHHSEDGGRVAWSVALTKGGNFAIYAEADSRDEKRLTVYDSLAEAFDDDVPEDVVAAAAAVLGVKRVIELDI